MDSTPPPAFGFAVGFGPLLQASDDRFHEVAGLAAEVDPVSLTVGGENRFVFRLPQAPKPTALVLRRGRVAASSPLVRWCREVLEGGLAQPVQPRNLRVFLLDAAGQPLFVWAFDDAWPVAWEVGALDAADDTLLLEKLQLSYSASRREHPAAPRHPA